MYDPHSCSDYSSSAGALEAIKALLQKRLLIIQDHAWRDRDRAGHLKALVEVGETLRDSIARLQKEYPQAIPAQLHHYFIKQSYEKALAWMEVEC